MRLARNHKVFTPTFRWCAIFTWLEGKLYSHCLCNLIFWVLRLLQQLQIISKNSNLVFIYFSFAQIAQLFTNVDPFFGRLAAALELRASNFNFNSHSKRMWPEVTAQACEQYWNAEAQPLWTTYLISCPCLFITD